jgi:tetratricopeptide (TPR) repeat protein
MSFDIYQQCPCHIGKKIKFCCGKDVIDDLNEALAKHQSGQSQAALEQLDRAINQLGEKDCLSAVKTFVQIAVQDVEGADATNEGLLKRVPNHPTALQNRALIEMMRGEVDQATLSLQDAMDEIKGTELPVSLARAFESLGMALVAKKNILAARAHLSFALFLKEQDQRLEHMLRELYNPSGAVLFLKTDHQLDPPVEGAEWEKPFTNVHKAVGRGQFRRALGMLLQLNEQFPDQPEISKGLAVVTSMFGPLEAQIASWRQIAEMPSTDPKDAIEYHGLAEVIAAMSGAEGFIPVNRSTWEVDDFDRVSEACISCDAMVAMDPGPDHDPFNEGPAPRAGYMVMDKPQLRSAEDLSMDTVPFSVGEVLVYGKQTDRSARVELVCVGNDRFESAKDSLKEMLQLSGEPTTVAFDKVNQGSDAITWNWNLPEDTSREQHQDLLGEMKKIALQRWLDLKQDFVEGKTVREVAGDKELENWVQAKLLHLEQTANGEAFSSESIDELRKELGVSLLEPLAPAEDEFLTPMQMCRIDAEKLSDDQLLGYFQIATMTQNFSALKHLTPEVLKREELEGARRDICHINMARFSESHEEALEHFAKSRAEAAKIGAPLGILLVAEFEYRLRNGLEDIWKNQALNRSWLDFSRPLAFIPEPSRKEVRINPLKLLRLNPPKAVDQRQRPGSGFRTKLNRNFIYTPVPSFHQLLPYRVCHAQVVPIQSP